MNSDTSKARLISLAGTSYLILPPGVRLPEGFCGLADVRAAEHGCVQLQFQRHVRLTWQRVTVLRPQRITAWWLNTINGMGLRQSDNRTASVQVQAYRAGYGYIAYVADLATVTGASLDAILSAPFLNDECGRNISWPVYQSQAALPTYGNTNEWRDVPGADLLSHSGRKIAEERFLSMAVVNGWDI